MNRTFKYFLLAVTSVMAIASCTEGEGPAATDDNEPKVESFAFRAQTLNVVIGKTATLEICTLMGSDTTGLYDLGANKWSITFTSSARSVATVGADGVVTGVAKGSAKISAYSAKLGKTRSMTVNVLNSDGDVPEEQGEDLSHYHFSQNFDHVLTEDNIYLKKGIVHTTMQGLDIDKDGLAYISWEEDSQVHISTDYTIRSKDMIVKYAAHGDNFFVENADGKTYVWASLSTGKESGYNGGKANSSEPRFVGRYEYKQGTQVYPEECNVGYYVGNNGARMASLDAEHGYFAFWMVENGSETMKIYKYADMKTAPSKTLTITRDDKKASSVEVKDLTKIKAVNIFTFNRKTTNGIRASDNSTRAMQGFCTYDGYLYLGVGFKEEDAARVTVMDFNGKIIKTLVPVGVTTDKKALISFGLSSDGTFEAEGIQIHKGVFYAGYVGDFKTAGEKKHACILKFE